MDCLAEKVILSNTFSDISDFSTTNRRVTGSDLKTDAFLDKILNFQKIIRERAVFFEEITSKIERASWSGLVGDKKRVEEVKSKLSNEELEELENTPLEVIILKFYDECSVIHRSFIREYVYFNNNFREFASADIRRLKYALDDFKESLSDLKLIYFDLASDNEFNLLNGELDDL